MESNYNVNFDQSFYPDLLYISKILEISDKHDFLTKEEISELTGIPTGEKSGKVEPHIMYAYYMNLIDLKKENSSYKLNKTKLGNLIYNEDQYFVEDITKVLLHYFLTSKQFGADLWYRGIREYPLTLGKEIDEQVIINELEEHYNKKIKLTAFKGCYTKPNSLGGLKLLTIEKNMTYYSNLTYAKEMFYALAYTLISELERLDCHRKEFTLDEVFDDLKWKDAFLWSEKFAMDIIEQFEERGIVKLNKQLVPITLIINKSSGSVLEEIYSLLI